MTYNRLVEDCNELIDALRNRLNTDKVFLVGHSAGSIIGLKTANKYPEKIHTYVGVGQIIDEYERQQMWYSFIRDEAEKSGDVKTQNTIKEMGPPPFDTLEDVHIVEDCISKFGGVVHENGIQQMLALMVRVFTSPEYSLVEAFNTFVLMKGRDFTMNAMWEDIRSVKLTKEIQYIKVPIYFFEGQYDMAAPIKPVKNFYDTLIAEKGKQFIVFKNSAHFLMVEEKERYQDLIVNVVLKDSLGK